MKVFAHSADPDCRRLLQAACKDAGHSLILVDNVNSARGILNAGFQLAFIEVPSEGIGPAEAMAEIRQTCPQLPVVLIARETLDPQTIESCQALKIFGYFYEVPRLSDLQGILAKAAASSR